MKKPFDQVLREIMKESNLNSVDLMEKTQSSDLTVAKWMGGGGTPNFEKLRTIIEVTGVDANRFFCEEV